MAPRDPIARELASLRKREGLTLDKLQRCRHLVEALGQPTLADAYASLVAAAQALGEGGPRQSTSKRIRDRRQ